MSPILQDRFKKYRTIESGRKRSEFKTDAHLVQGGGVEVPGQEAVGCNKNKTPRSAAEQIRMERECSSLTEKAPGC
ncbi:hypothetical protein TNCV_536141 [Trichonephila clavipes]|nr:hypothetical protein TNCV_536141 [Trichonephila clavipes]